MIILWASATLGDKGNTVLNIEKIPGNIYSSDPEESYKNIVDSFEIRKGCLNGLYNRPLRSAYVRCLEMIYESGDKAYICGADQKEKVISYYNFSGLKAS